MQKQQPTLPGFPCGGALVFRRCPLSPTSFRITHTSLCHGPEGPEPSAAPTSPPCFLLPVRSLTRLTPAVLDPLAYVLGVCLSHCRGSAYMVLLAGMFPPPRSLRPAPQNHKVPSSTSFGASPYLKRHLLSLFSPLFHFISFRSIHCHHH